MTSQPRKSKKISLDKKDDVFGIYIKSVLEKKISLDITEIGANIKQILENKLCEKYQGKCIPEGFIKPGSIKITAFSNGIIITDNIEYHVIFECFICNPVESQLIECTSKTITKAGIHAEVKDDNTIPLQIFIAKDHHIMDYYFSTIKENMSILVKVIGVRYELNDPYICVIAKLSNNSEKEGDHPKKTQEKQKKKIKLI